MNTATRTLIGFPPALLVTLGLLAVMITLMGNQNVETEKTVKIKIPNILMPPVEVVEVNPIIRPVRPVIDQTPPPQVTRQPFEKIDGGLSIIAEKAPKITEENHLTIGGGMPDQDIGPIVKVAPVYPNRAAERGIEGDVLLEYTVTKSGSVINPRVIESASTIFNQSALNSALKYKYSPRIIGGQAVEVTGVRTVIKFRLEK